MQRLVVVTLAATGFGVKLGHAPDESPRLHDHMGRLSLPLETTHTGVPVAGMSDLCCHGYSNEEKR